MAGPNSGSRRGRRGRARVRGARAEARVPPRVEEYAAGCVRAVERALGVTLDYAPETLPLLDHYLGLLPDRPRRATRDPVRGLVATLAGVYFGEVVRRLFPSRWAVSPGADPIDWRLEFRYCFLTFHPVAVAWEVILRRDVPDCCTAFLFDEPTCGLIARRLDALPGVTVDDYYTLAQRLETLVFAAGWLAERAQQQAGDDRPRAVSSRRYRDFLRIRTRE